MKILLIGGGGREHALAWRLRHDDPAVELVAAPGNPGIATLARCVSIPVTDLDALVGLAEAERPAFTIVGPEAPLAAGIVDRFRARGLPIFGPTQGAAEIETSKTFAKQVMADAGVPTARAESHTDAAAAKRAARAFGAPVVIKASGLAAGKGVVVCETVADADAAIDRMLTEGVFGAAGREILVEEFMQGEEVSVFGITDGERIVPLLPAQDHKRLLDGDKGPNTGGMGAFAPYAVEGCGAWAGFELVEPCDGPLGFAGIIADTIMAPTLEALRARGRPFTGLLYAGLMLTRSGPMVVEFNCRFGDPETEAIMPLTAPGIGALLHTVAVGDRLPERDDVELRLQHAVTTVVAAAGYPESPRTGDVIHLPDVPDGVHVFHAGTARRADGALVSAGGRVLAVTAVAPSLAAAQHRSVVAASRVELAGKQFRTDIGWRELSRARAT
ncbi:MAG TPA: phosphoribosylamine--glycine ligase [Gemmatimonadaceae bacterium]|nr:phosphoribosylamine--glycine ligase [Gemmatimonadaceae bacterium]